MDCIEAQAIISEAIDRQPIDATVLEAAKQHCRSCPQCGEFVRALNIVQRAPLPAPPAELADRVMALVRAEAAAAEQAATTVTEEAAEADALESALDESAPLTDTRASGLDDSEDESSALVVAATMARAKIAEDAAKRVSVSSGTRLTRPRDLLWLAGAAAVLVVVVIGASTTILASMNARRSSGDLGTTYSEAPAADMAAAPQTTESSAPAEKTAGQSAPASSTVLFITNNGLVYRQAGTVKPSLPGASAVGTVTMSFSAQAPVQDYVAYTAEGEPDALYIAKAPQSFERFDLVTRSYKAVTYALGSSPIASFGAWPTLPSGISAPTQPDGSPQFVEDGTDALGVTVYRGSNGTAADGIAIAPGTPATDPAAGNPNWTWWTPRR